MKHTSLLTASGAAFAAALALMLPGAANAVSITSSYAAVPGKAFNTAGLTGFQTHGSDMGGMRVTVTFAGGGTETATWVAGAGLFGSAVGTGWELEQPGDTFTTHWLLRNTGTAASIIGLTIEGAPGKTTFDIVTTPETSPGSASGNPFGSVEDLSSGANVTAIDGTYSNRLLVNNVFYGDLYETLSLAFSGELQAGSRIQFLADTDNAPTRFDVVPEPASIALFGLGLAGLGLVRRRRRG